MTTRPAILIPHALKPLTEHKRWLIWRWEQKDNGEWTKVPYQGHATSRKADTTNPKTWCYVKSAMLAYTQGKCDGVGYVLTDGDIGAIDIDDCRNATTGELHPWAAERITRSNSYVEVTPSNEGVRIIGFSNGGIPLNNPYAVPNTDVSGELFRRPGGRYITITGNQIGATAELVNIDAQLDLLVPLLVTEPSGSGGRPKQAGGKFGAVNERALVNLDKWVRNLFPTAKRTRHGGYRVKSADLGRGFQEDLSISPKGIKYFGVADQGDKRKGRRTPVELIAEWQHVEQPQATEWLEKILTATTEEAKPEPPEPPPQEQSATDADVEITRLAKLTALEYEQQRKDAAEKLGISRIKVLDDLVERERERLGLSGADEKQAVSLYEHWNGEAASEPVDLGILLRAVKETIRRYVFMSDDQATVVTLWTVFSWLHERVTHSPLLFVTSAERDSGKTTLLGVVNFLARRSLQSVDISGPALFRSITKWEPTFIVDEADVALVNNPDLASVINSGWTRGQGVVRCHPETHEPELFRTFAPKVVAMKGRNLPDTTLSRSIIITMKPRRAGAPKEHAEDFDHLDNETFVRLRSQVIRWVADNANALAKATPEIPPGLHNRRRANWVPLLAIAEAARGGEWKTAAWKAVRAIEAIADTFDASVGVELLRAIKAAFEARAKEQRNKDRITAPGLNELLIADETARWATYNKGKPIAQAQVKRLLQPHGIEPKTIRWDDGTKDGSYPKGYLLEWFTDVFDRYCTSSSPETPEKPSTCSTDLFSFNNPVSTSPPSPPHVETEKSFETNDVEHVEGKSGGRPQTRAWPQDATRSDRHPATPSIPAPSCRCRTRGRTPSTRTASRWRRAAGRRSSLA